MNTRILLSALLLLFTTPAIRAADPWVVYENGYYYLARSQGNSVWITRATSLEDIHQNSGRSTSVRAWAAPTGTAYSSQIWAPELHHFGNNWYIYVAASDGEALEAAVLLSRTEGIIPALESAHAIAEAVKRAPAAHGKIFLVNVSGRGDKDIDIYRENLKELDAQ